MSESFLEKSFRRRREEGTDWTPELELEWLRKHPEDRPEGWTDPEVFDEDLIPDVGGDYTPDALAPHLDRLTTFEAYNRWNAKGLTVDPKGKAEVKLRCPFSDHTDNDPSAWIAVGKVGKDAGTCASCGGFDKYDIAADHFGMPRPGYKDKAFFPDLRRMMAQDLGYVEVRTPAGAVLVVEPESDLEPPSSHTQPPEPQPVPAPSKLAPVVPIHADDDDDDEGIFELEDERPFIDWEDICPPETFLWDWMHSTAVPDDLPHEYYFALGLQAIASAVGTNLWLDDRTPVKPNLYVCLYGTTGIGKSRATGPYLKLLERALPYTGDDFTPSTGTMIMPVPGSAEAMLRMLAHEIKDPSTMAMVSRAPVRSLLRVDEFSGFVARASRPGNSLKEVLIDLYDHRGEEYIHYSLSGGKVIAREPFLQMLTTTQPMAIHSFLRRSDAHSGFLNRWLFITGERRQRRISYGGGGFDIDSCVRMLESIHNWGLTPRRYEFAGPALDAWDKFYHDVIGPVYDKTQDAMVSRIDLNLKKIIMLLSANEHLDQPTADVVQRATKLFNYLKLMARMFTRDLAYTEGEECQEKIIKIIEKFAAKGQEVTLRELSQQANKAFTRDQIEKALKTLEVLDMIKMTVAKGTRGPLAKKYTLNV